MVLHSGSILEGHTLLEKSKTPKPKSQPKPDTTRHRTPVKSKSFSNDRPLNPPRDPETPLIQQDTEKITGFLCIFHLRNIPYLVAEFISTKKYALFLF